jgi:hypothetical protein
MRMQKAECRMRGWEGGETGSPARDGVRYSRPGQGMDGMDVVEGVLS